MKARFIIVDDTLYNNYITKKRFLYLFEINAIIFKIINKLIRRRLDSFLIINYI